MDYLQLLKKHKRDADRSRALWSGTTPVLRCAYHRNFGEFCFHVSHLLVTVWLCYSMSTFVISCTHVLLKCLLFILHFSFKVVSVFVTN